MKLKVSALCWECVKEAGNTKEDYQQLIRDHPEMAGEYLIELNQDNLYRIECHNGHVSYTVLQHQKFELLFDFAAMALLDGYTREAVADMAAALERFYEFYISTICLEKGIVVENMSSSGNYWTNNQNDSLELFYS